MSDQKTLIREILTTAWGKKYSVREWSQKINQIGLSLNIEILYAGLAKRKSRQGSLTLTGVVISASFAYKVKLYFQVASG